MKRSDRKGLLESVGVPVAALGVVFGDIGTSPLYALRECFVGDHGMSIDKANVLGAASLIFWLLCIIVCVKYVTVMMRADNKGEGGILALMALVNRLGSSKVKHFAIVSLAGMIGASLLFSDGIITPAISVLSAVEGLTVVTQCLSPLIIPLSIGILALLFVLQSRGTTKVGKIFGPVIILWFLMIAALGIYAIYQAPAILQCLNPVYAIELFVNNEAKAFSILGTAFLAVTGAEVLYADMGHFTRKAIRIDWWCIVFPSLILNYLGQGAYLLNAHALPDNLFYRICPSWFLLPSIVVATLATIIASQAVITGMFSLASQAVQMGFWPRLRIIFTSEANIGQVYIPIINVTLFVFVCLLILMFRHSDNLALAYGIAVSATMLITSMLAFFLPRDFWRIPRYILYPMLAGFLALDSSLVCSNFLKIATGGWIVVLLSIAVVLMMTTWQKGRSLLQKSVGARSLPVGAFLADVTAKNYPRVPGTAVFLSENAFAIPHALLHNFKHNQTLHSRIVLLSVSNEDVPFIVNGDRFSVSDKGAGFYSAALRFGFMENPDLPAVLRKIEIDGKLIDPAQISYFLGKESLMVTDRPTMSGWRKRLFLLMSRNAFTASSFFKLQVNRVIELGSQLEF